MSSWKLRVQLGAATVGVLSLLSGSCAAQTAPEPLQQSRGFYVGGGVGANFQEDNRFRGGGADSNASYDPGYVGLLNFGYALGNGLRVELEPGYRRNDVDSISGVGGHGRSSIASAMVNGIYDLPYAIPYLPDWQPHLGLGAGAAMVDNHSASHNGFLLTRNDTVPAFQGIVGLDHAIAPAIKVGVDYRYFVAHDADFHNSTTGARVKGGDFNDHSILVTFRYEFGAPH
jgi:OmpA-OmpF porin, OOP family